MTTIDQLTDIIARGEQLNVEFKSERWKKYTQGPRLQNSVPVICRRGPKYFEIPLNRHFYSYEPPCELLGIEADIKELEGEILDLLREVTA